MKKRNLFSRLSPLELNMTPMIDVVFLLIIFFMVVTKFSNQTLSEDIVLPLQTNPLQILMLTVSWSMLTVTEGILYQEERIPFISLQAECQHTDPGEVMTQ